MEAVWMYAGNPDSIDEGEAIRVDFESRPSIAIFNVNGEFYSIDDTCTHAEASLSDGYIDGEVVECAFHFAKFAIRTGAVLSPPASKSLRSYPVKVADGGLYVELADDPTED